ncbi:MAG: hypothetical protein ACRD3O_20045, partial [Terriglobia bacterium]
MAGERQVDGRSLRGRKMALLSPGDKGKTSGELGAGGLRGEFGHGFVDNARALPTTPQPPHRQKQDDSRV